MKVFKYLAEIIIVISIFTSCSASRKESSAAKTVNGSWTLQTINMEGIKTKFAAKIFNEADLNCFVGSSWDFAYRKGTGSYSLIGGTQGCATLQRNISWIITEPKDAPKEFQFKRLDGSNNSIDDVNGFRLNVTVLNAGNMQLKSAITFEDQPGNIVYNFVKNK